MKYKYLIIGFWLVYNIGYSQEGSIFVELNYNSFMHNSLKSFQEEFRGDMPEIPIKINDNFPANFGITAGYKINSLDAALLFSYNSTGGKISYSDYSGIVRLTQPLKAYSLGGEYFIELDKSSSNLSLGLKGFMTYSMLEIDSYTQIADEVNKDNIKLQSIDFGVGGRLIYEYPLSFFMLRASIGVDVVIGGKLKFKENNEYHLENNNGDPVKTNWTGLRTGIGISVPL